MREISARGARQAPARALSSAGLSAGFLAIFFMALLAGPSAGADSASRMESASQRDSASRTDSVSQRDSLPRGSSVIAAYQKIYGMNFEVYRPDGLSPGWFVTFDGYPVAQVAPHHWVYGRVERPGTLVPADVAVGSVVPMDIPELARTAVSPRRGSACEAQAFRRIAFSGLDNMGVLDDSMAYTPIAWKSGEPGLRIWLGTRWYRVVPAGGQTTAQALRSQYAFIVRTLRKRNKPWTRSDTRDLADLAREWGYLWRGSVAFSALSRFRDGFGGGNDGGASGGTAPGGAEPGGTTTGGGEWDTGAAAGEGGGGGGWDTGGGGGNNNGGGGGWDK